MTATRRAPPLEIFQDPVTSFDQNGSPGVEARLLHALNPVDDVSSDHHTLLNPPSPKPIGRSPLKTSRQSSSPPPSALAESNLNSISFPPPIQNIFVTDSPMKKLQAPAKRSGALSKKQDPLFTRFASQSFDKENVATAILKDDKVQFSDPVYGYKLQNKRTLMEAASLKERTNKKQKVEDQGPLPEPHEMPLIEDDGAKPSHSYAKLIAMAILRAPNRRLTLAQIYKWISDTFKWYGAAETGWQNSIRHNLSLNKAFIKIDRPKDDPGKGHYWAIEPGMEWNFLQEKPRRSTNPDTFVHSLPTEGTRPSTAPSLGAPHQNKSMKKIDSSKFPEETELSSDATIPCSDPAIHDGQDPEALMPPPSRAIRSSPPPMEIHSSPPPPISRPAMREGTPPRAARFPPSSRSGGRKRKFTALGDSGYYSSIESSATKGHPLGPLLTSEADHDRPIHKRGRAEEEIARIRGSSYESPTKTRPLMKPPAVHPPSSSPFRPFDPMGDGPLTPAVIFKRPLRPPLSVSPNTSLRNHRNRMRELIGSPDKSLDVMDDRFAGETWPWSPAFPVPDEENFNLHESGFKDAFDVFNDESFGGSLSARGSPEKRPMKRPRLERASTTANILADITGMKANTRLMPPTPSLKSPFLKFTSLDSPARTGSPTKAPTSHPQKSVSFDPKKDEFFGVDLRSDDSEEAGFDILQGFQKIGASAAAQASPSKPPTRPGLGRSSTSMF